MTKIFGTVVELWSKVAILFWPWMREIKRRKWTIPRPEGRLAGLATPEISYVRFNVTVKRVYMSWIFQFQVTVGDALWLRRDRTALQSYAVYALGAEIVNKALSLPAITTLQVHDTYHSSPGNRVSDPHHHHHHHQQQQQITVSQSDDTQQGDATAVRRQW